MFGGVLVYAITLGCQRFRYRRIFYFVLSALSLLFLHNTYIAALLFGLLLSDLLYNNHIALKLDQKLCNILRSPRTKIVLIPALILSAAAVVMDIRFSQYFQLLFVLILILWLSYEGTAARFLGAKLLTKLSEYTFALYVLHWPILCSFSCMAVVHLPFNSYPLRVIIACIILFSLGIPASYILRRYVEIPFKRLTTYLPFQIKKSL